MSPIGPSTIGEGVFRPRSQPLPPDGDSDG